MGEVRPSLHHLLHVGQISGWGGGVERKRRVEENLDRVEDFKNLIVKKIENSFTMKFQRNEGDWVISKKKKSQFYSRS